MIPTRCSPFRITLLACAATLVAGLLLLSCDQMTGPSVRSESEALSTAGGLPDSTVFLTPMDPDEGLLAVGETQRIEPESGPTPGEDAASQSRVEKRSLRAESNLKGQPSGKVASPYGCVLSTPNVGADSSEGAYRYEAAFALFPEWIVEKAGGEVQRYEFGASRPRRTSGQQTTKAEVLRQARCRIPDTKEAERLIRRRLVRVPSPTDPWTGQITVANTPSSPVLQPKASGGCGVDEELEAVHVCFKTCGTDKNCEETELECEYVMRCVQEENDGNDGSGGLGGSDGSGGNGQTGSDPDECSYEGGPTDELCGGGGGSGTDPLDPLNPCESADPPEWCDIGCKLSATELEDGDYLFGQASDGAKSTFIETLEEHGGDYGLDSKKDIKHFIAQTAHESGGKITAVETGGAATSTITRKELLATEWVGPNAEYSIDEVMGNDELMTNIDRANKLGNGPPSSGDGWTYRGRGPIQFTWKGAYRNFTNHYQGEEFGNTDFVDNPEKLSNDAKAGTLAALWYWENRVLPQVDGDLTVKKLTQAINNGTTGLQDRKNQFEAAKDAINCDS